MLCLFYLQKRRKNIGKDVGAYLKYAEKRKETDIFMTALYETWTFQQEVPGLIQDLLNRLQKQKTSTKASDCSQYNTCRAKSATLHAPTLRAILWLAELYEGLETEGAVGRQFGENNETNYYCMEYKNKDVSYALIYNWKNGRFKGCVQKGDTVLKISSIQKDKHIVELYIAYLERINEQETYILFLRNTKQPDTPYYTLEVEPGGVIRQKRTEYDRQNKDIEAASAFLREWQQEIQKRITENDRELANRSRQLRMESYAEMRKKKVKINGGLFQGKYLADVLEADLMEMPDTLQQAAYLK